MRRDPVLIGRALGSLVIQVFVEKLRGDRVYVLAAAGDSTHLHLLARFVDDLPRMWVGRAKKNASHIVRQKGLRAELGGLWSKRSKITPIKGRRHQIAVFEYIIAHEKRGAVVWRFDKDGEKDSLK
jgi:hypothetical protein